jgi:hypothetical protein
MHPFQTAELARLRHAELLHEADQARLASVAHRASRLRAHDHTPDPTSRMRLALIGAATVVVAGVGMLVGGIIPLELLASIRIR